MTTDVDIAYLAGLVDGEGCLAVRTRIDGYINVSLEVVGTDRRPLDWAAERFGGTVGHLQERRPNRRQPYHWRITKVAHLAEVARLIRPYLKVKRAEASLLVIIGLLRKAKRTPYSPNEYRQAEVHLSKLSTLLKQADTDRAAYEEVLDLAIYLRGLIEETHEVTHRCPPDGSGIMPCCGRTGFEVPPSDRITVHPTLVTCGRQP